MTAAAPAHRAIELELTIQAPPERVFAAFTDQALLESWFVRRAEVDPRPGGSFGCFWSTAHVMGTFLEVDPPGRIVIEFDERPIAEGKTLLHLMVSPEGTGTRLHFKHTGFPVGPGWDELYKGMGAGWPHALADLTVLLETGVPVENGFRHV